MENTQRASSSLVSKGLLVFGLSDLRVLSCMATTFFVLFHLIFMNLPLFVLWSQELVCSSLVNHAVSRDLFTFSVIQGHDSVLWCWFVVSVGVYFEATSFYRQFRSKDS